VLALAWQTVRRQPGRFLALATVVALPIVLVLVVSAVYVGLLDAMIAYPSSLPGDVVAVESGATPIFMRSGSRLAPDVLAEVRAVPGVAGVDPLYGRLVWVQCGGRGAFVYVIGIFPDDRVGGPLRLLAGTLPAELDEIVVDRVLADDLGLALRSSLRVGEARLRVSGIAAGGNSVIGTFAFANRNALGLAGVDTPSHLFVAASPGVDAAMLRRRVARVPGVRAYTRAEFLDDTLSLAKRFYRPILVVIAGLSAAVAATILALALAGTLREQRSDFGLLAALGLSRGQLYAAALWQAVLVTGLGAAAGVVAGQAASSALSAAVPRFATHVPWWLAAMAAAGALAIGIVAALLPVRSVARVDPADVFRV
jgi:putative ABC transport system permease protein